MKKLFIVVLAFSFIVVKGQDTIKQTKKQTPEQIKLQKDLVKVISGALPIYEKVDNLYLKVDTVGKDVKNIFLNVAGLTKNAEKIANYAVKVSLQNDSLRNTVNMLVEEANTAKKERLKAEIAKREQEVLSQKERKDNKEYDTIYNVLILSGIFLIIVTNFYNRKTSKKTFQNV